MYSHFINTYYPLSFILTLTNAIFIQCSVCICSVIFPFGLLVHQHGHEHLGGTVMPAYSDTLGERQKCHCKGGVTVTTYTLLQNKKVVTVGISILYCWIVSIIVVYDFDIDICFSRSRLILSNANNVTELSSFCK